MRQGMRCAAVLALITMGACGGGGGSQPLPALFVFDHEIPTDNPYTGGGDIPVGMGLGDVYGDGTTDVVMGYVSGFPGAAATYGALPTTPYSYLSFILGSEQGIAIGDFIEDASGYLDAVVTVHRPDVNELTVLDNSFPTSPFYALATPPIALQNLPTRLAAGDWNGDGHLDVAIIEPLATQIEILLGDGAGGFEPPVRTGANETGLTPLAILAADFTGDGAPDLAVANGFAGTVTIFRNVGEGAFTSLGEFAAADSVRALAAGDLDGDDDLDLVVAGYTSDEVAILLGNGDGTFAAPSLIALSQDSGPMSIALADFDDDEDLDFVVGLGIEHRIQAFRNDGSGTFSPYFPSKYSWVIGGELIQVEAADMTGDGRPDVVVLLENGFNAIVIMKNTWE